MTSPVGLTFVVAVVLPLAVGGKMACIAAVGEAVQGAAVRSAKSSGDDVARAGKRVARDASGYADDVAAGATRTGGRVSGRVWSTFTQSLDDAVAASKNAGQALESASARIGPRALKVLVRKYEQNQDAIQNERDRASSGYQSDKECADATARLQKVMAEQVAIKKLIEKMG